MDMLKDKNVCIIGGGAGSTIVGCSELVKTIEITQMKDKGLHLVSDVADDNDKNKCVGEKISDIIKKDRAFPITNTFIDNDLIRNEKPLTKREVAEFKSHKFYDNLYKKRSKKH